MTRGLAGLSHYWLLGALAGVASILFVGSLGLGAHRIDGAERTAEEMLVGRDVPRRIVEVADRIKPFFIWDEAMQRLDNKFDVAWANDNIGSLVRSSTFSRVLVVDHADTPVYGATAADGAAVTDIHLASATQSAIAEVRAAEARPLPPVTTPVRATRIAIVHGEPMIIVANLVRSDTGVHRPEHGQPPILVAETRVDVALREAFAERFGLAGLKTEIVRGASAPEGAGVTLGTAKDGRLIRLSWTPKRPGQELLARSAPFLALATLILLGAGTTLVTQARRAANRLVRSQEQARLIALHDPLTGLANRLLLADRLNQACETHKRRPNGVAVLCLDLDRFKEVNDSYGHDAGDELLREVARRLRSVCRAEDTVARLGGDEFAILQSAPTGGIGAVSLAERIVEILSGPVQLTAGSAVLSCSVGVAVIDAPDGDTAEILRQADLALYRAKERGRGRYCFFEPEMDQALRARKAMENDLRELITTGGLDVHYQPLVNEDGRVVGAEALARWMDPVRGSVAPTVFIKLAEECGLICQLSQRVLRRACEDSRRWPGIRVAVNLSPIQLRQSDFLSTLEVILKETGATPSCMDLEITEGCLLQDDRQTHDVLAALRVMGFDLALDDFGTGYSSLSYLHRYPVQKIKLDRAFTMRLGVAPEAQAIAAAVLGMAAALKLNVVAEGVETAEQFQTLRELGCREFQGYLFARAVPAEVMTQLIGERSLVSS